ncbi:(2Fe-2S)-binding protein [Acidaminococcus timonensis]|uniref:(2Fe-2S)-binding protein n=1 Tax=Acidaminococcus timonensis TaxID=1871002 RepID=UPI002941CD27|nr:(2Fe-2S)-binding protein [Acidaminococcus timonensis]
MNISEKETGLADATRILEHPILGMQNEDKKIVEFTFDGKTVQGYEGEPIAAALKAAGVLIHRYTQKQHKPRGIFCAIGRCTDCVMIVDGKPNIRTCMAPLKAGMKVQTQYGVSSLPFDQQGTVVKK